MSNKIYHEDLVTLCLKIPRSLHNAIEKELRGYQMKNLKAGVKPFSKNRFAQEMIKLGLTEWKAE